MEMEIQAHDVFDDSLDSNLKVALDASALMASNYAQCNHPLLNTLNQDLCH